MDALKLFFAVLLQKALAVSEKTESLTSVAFSEATASSGDKVIHVFDMPHISTAEEIFKKNAVVMEEGIQRANDLARKHHESVARQIETIMQTTKERHYFSPVDRLYSESEKNSDRSKEKKKRNGISSNLYSSSSSSSTSSDGKHYSTSSFMSPDCSGVKYTRLSSEDPDRVYTWTDQQNTESCDQTDTTSFSASASASASATTFDGKGHFQSSTMTSGPNGVKRTFHSSDDPDNVYVWTNKN